MVQEFTRNTNLLKSKGVEYLTYMSHFILAMQASQVYFATYPTLRRNMNDWLAVCQIKARSIVEVSDSNICLPFDVLALQEDVCQQHGIDMELDDQHPSLNDVNGNQ